MSEFNTLLTGWRRHLHAHPELALQETNTAAFVAEKLREMGIEVTENVGKTGVVGTLKMGDGGRTIGLRADMDAITLQEKNTFDYRSDTDGVMHGCGHDGHTTSLLGAAKLLSESRNLNGIVRFIFQPGEEPGKGARAMIEDGLLERFPMDEIYGLHNGPQITGGRLETCVGGCCSSEDNFKIVIRGRGSHASQPHLSIDPLVIASQIILALQTIVSRNSDPLQTAVVSCTELFTDGGHNAIPGTVTILGDARSYTSEIQKLIEQRMRAIGKGICDANGADCTVEYTHEFAPTVNWAECVATMAKAAGKVLGESNVDDNARPISGSEDFGLFLRYIPGCFAFYGTGKKDIVDFVPLHNPHYDYNDEYLETAAKLYVEIAKTALEK